MSEIITTLTKNDYSVAIESTDTGTTLGENLTTVVTSTEYVITTVGTGFTINTGGGGGGVSDHGELTGLGDDDHTQYHNDTRGDARYYTKSQSDSLLDGKQPEATVLTNTTASFTTALETKLGGIASGAEVNVNADWSAVSGDAEILNKPSTYAPSAHSHAISDVTGLQTALNGKQAALSGVGFVKSAGGTISYDNVVHANGVPSLDNTGILCSDGSTLLFPTISGLPFFDVAGGDIFVTLNLVGLDDYVHSVYSIIPTDGTSANIPYASSTLTGVVTSTMFDTWNAKLNQEQVEDLIGSSVIAGSNVTVSYNDTTGKTTISATGGGGGSGNSVTATVSFGSSFTDSASTVVTGQSWVAAGSEIAAQVLCGSGVDPLEIALLDFKIVISDLVAGVGFTVTLYSMPQARGDYSVMCIGV